jgi:hypothetical protein
VTEAARVAVVKRTRRTRALIKSAKEIRRYLAVEVVLQRFG